MIVCGIGTEVGKTVVSAIIASALGADYWKPIQCGEPDSEVLRQLLDSQAHTIHPARYSFKDPVSPLQAGGHIDPDQIVCPVTERGLIIEGVGGIMVPLNSHCHTLDLFRRWNLPWIVVSRHYLGSINHTLMTLEILRIANVNVVGVIFNGEPQPYSEEAIIKLGKVSCLGRLLPQKKIDRTTIQQIGMEWKPQLQSI